MTEETKLYIYGTNEPYVVLERGKQMIMKCAILSQITKRV